jgi:hypothetical protein
VRTVTARPQRWFRAVGLLDIPRFLFGFAARGAISVATVVVVVLAFATSIASEVVTIALVTDIALVDDVCIIAANIAATIVARYIVFVRARWANLIAANPADVFRGALVPAVVALASFHDVDVFHFAWHGHLLQVRVICRGRDMRPAVDSV